MLLVFGPTRRTLLGGWRLTVPLLLGGGFGLYYACRALTPGAPPILWVLLPLFGAGLFYSTMRDSFDDFTSHHKGKKP